MRQARLFAIQWTSWKRGAAIGIVCSVLDVFLGGYVVHLYAQTTNITSSGLNTAISSSDTTTFIDGGIRPGSGPNLFHSFGDFSIGEGHTALFRNSDNAATSNLFGRVTGGNESHIFGTIDSATHLPQANLWLINPAGFLFGPTASLNVGGSVNISTADYLKMTDGSRFNARPGPSDLPLSMAPVAAFGFLGTNPGGKITVQGGTVNNASALTIVGRDVVDGSGNTIKPGIEMPGGTLKNPGGSVNLISVKSVADPTNLTIGGEIGASDHNPTRFSSLGTITLKAGAGINTSTVDADKTVTTNLTNVAGGIFIQGGTLTMDGASLQATSRNPAPGDLTAGTKGGDISLVAESMNLRNSTIKTGAERPTTVSTLVGPGAGNLSLSGSNIAIENALLVTANNTRGANTGDRTSGSAGNITVKGIGGGDAEAKTVVLAGAELTQYVLGESDRHGGDLMISGRAVQLTDVKHMALSDDGQGGAVTIHSSDRISATNTDFSASSVFSGGGSIDLRAGSTIDLVASKLGATAFILGRGNISLSAATIRLTRTAISTTSGGLGGGGAIAFHANDLAVNNSTITSEMSEPTRPGSAGTITVNGLPDSNGLTGPARSVTIDNSRLSTSINGGGAASLPASIAIASQALTIVNGAEITAETKGAAPAGNITLTAGHLLATGGTQLSSSSRDAATGNAGNITLTSATDLILKNSAVTTSADQASGGGIKLTAPNTIFIADSTLTSSVQGQVGSNGGNISIDPIAVAIQNSQILANANAGAGGKITIAASGVLVDPNSRLSATAGPVGVSGSVNINAPIQVLGGTLVPLKVAYSQPVLSGDRCAADPQGQFSSFVQTGRDGVPQIPGGYAPSPLLPLNRLVSISRGVQGPRLAAVRLGLTNMGLDKSTPFQFRSTCGS